MSSNSKPQGDLTRRPYLTVDEAAVVLGIARVTAYRAVRSGQIPSIRLGRSIRVPTGQLLGMHGSPSPSPDESA